LTASCNAGDGTDDVESWPERSKALLDILKRIQNDAESEGMLQEGVHLHSHTGPEGMLKYLMQACHFVRVYTPSSSI